MTSFNPRLLAAKAVCQVLEKKSLHDSSEIMLSSRLRDSRDRALMRTIIYATLRRYYRYDAYLKLLCKKTLTGRQRVVHALLLSALAQLEQNITPDYAVITETVKTTRELGFPHLANFVNAVLRRFQREQLSLAQQLPQTEPLIWNHPQWLIDAIRAGYPSSWQAILEQNHQPAPCWLRINRRFLTADAYVQILHKNNIVSRRQSWLPDGLCIDQAGDPQALPGFTEGHVSVQDGAAQFAVELMDLKPGMRVLDACAAPGGKTAHILEREAHLESMLALDVQPQRTQRIQKNLQRLKLDATVDTQNAIQTSTWWDGTPFNRILLDAPCSGTGVIRRHPDIALLRASQDIAALNKKQDQLLDTLWPLLGVGGRLIYATCSILPDENMTRIQCFLTRTPTARIHMPDSALPIFMPITKLMTQYGIQFLPGQYECDGFFYAVLEKY